MTNRRRELEMLLMTGFAAVPLYLTAAISPLVVLAFHLGLFGIALAVWQDRAFPSLSKIGRVAGALYLPFFFIDALALSDSLIRASIHLLFFIALYQSLDESTRHAAPQRLLVAFLMFLTSLATSTHPTIVIFVLAFALMMFMQLMRETHEMSVADLGVREAAEPVGRSALGFAVPAALVAAALFPLLPRVHNPFVRGMSRGMESSATGISDTIDFRENRSISSDPSAVARVWMPQDAIAMFTPLRLRASVYDEWDDGQWVAKLRRTGEGVREPDQQIAIARREGFARGARIRQRTRTGGRLLLPEGTYSVIGLEELTVFDAYQTAYHPTDIRGEPVKGELNFQVAMSRQASPLIARPAVIADYPIAPAVRQFALEIAGGEESVEGKARAIERHLSTRFRYLADPAELGRPVSVDEFLLEVRRGHCEYFAAGMVVLLASLDVPARIVGGFYGGELNPLIGSFVVRQSDAHAWVEVHDGQRWITFDPTPASLRPGTGARNLVRAYFDAARDAVVYFWDRYILTFGTDDQVSLIMRAFYALREMRSSVAAAVGNAASSARDNAWELLGAAALLGALAFILATRFRRRAGYERLLELLRERGIEIEASTSPGELLAIVESRRNDLMPHVRPVVWTYLQDRFSPSPAPSELRDAARRGLSEIENSA